MPDLKRPTEVLLGDPLGDVTRAERKLLLAISALGIIVVKTGLVPSKIAALGIEFAETSRAALLKAVAAVICYFLVAFFVYALSDFLAWRSAFQFAFRDWQKRRKLLTPDERSAEDQAFDDYFHRSRLWSGVWRRLNNPVATLRGIFDFIVPIVVAIYAVLLLLTTPPPHEVRTTQPPPAPHSVPHGTSPSTETQIGSTLTSRPA